MNARNLLGRQRRSVLARQLYQQVGKPVLLLGRQFPYFCNGLFKALCHARMLAFDDANFQLVERHSSDASFGSMGGER